MVEAPTGQPSDSDAARMRARPPESTLRWLVDSLDARLVDTVEAMPGGSTCAMHRIGIVLRDGSTQTVVMRRYVLADRVGDATAVAAQEMRALEIVRQLGVPTPEPLAGDPAASVTDVPTVVMSLVDGQPVWDTRAKRQWIAQIVTAMVALHEIDANDYLPAIARYEQAVYEPPRWSERPAMWESAFQLFHGPMPASDVGFVHRDFNPGNVLWTRGRLTGLVDWQAACNGPRSIDPAHCCLNLLYYDPAMARDLRLEWEHQSGRSYEPWADLMSIGGALDSFRTRRKPSNTTAAIEDVLARAVTDLTG